MNAERRVELTGDPQIKKLLERIRELEEALTEAICILDVDEWPEMIEIGSAVDCLKAVLAKKEEA